MNAGNNAAHEMGWLDKVKEIVRYDSWKSSLEDLNYKHLIVYAVIGFLTGLLFKRFGRYFVFTIVVGGLILYFMHSSHIITLDVVKLKATFGLGSNESFTMLLTHLWQWITHNIILSIATAVGFIIGYKVGS